MLRTRVLTAVIAIPIVFAMAYLGGWWFYLPLGALLLLGGHEFCALMRSAGYNPSEPACLGLVAALLIDSILPGYRIGRFALVATIAIEATRHIIRNQTKGFLVNWALMLAGALYVGGLGSHFIALRALPGGLGWLALAVIPTWVCDSAAYFVGTSRGRQGFFTAISPHKTWEGFIGGWLSGAIAAVAAGLFLKLTLAQAIVLGLVLPLAATFGDLAESLLKRQVGAKDSGTFFPGHGGVLDRADSLLFVVPLVYYYLIWVVGITAR